MRRTSTPSTAKRSGAVANRLTTTAARWRRTARSIASALVCLSLLALLFCVLLSGWATAWPVGRGGRQPPSLPGYLMASLHGATLMASLHAATLMGGKPLPNCRDAPHGVWHWIDPTGPTRPLTVDKSGNWNHGQLIAPPAVTAAQPAWLEALRSWREGCISFLGLDESPVIFDDPQLTWTQTSFVHVQERLAHPTHTPGPPHTRHGRWRHGK